jgi:hypothetical protein
LTTSTQCDAVQGTGPGGPVLARRVYNTSNSAATTGSVDGFDYGLVTQFLWGTYASATPYGAGCYGLSLAASARPVLGTTVNLVTSGIPAGTLLGATVFSNTQHNPGIDLTGIGMPGCHQYINLDVSHVFLVSGTSATVPQPVPASTSFIGVQLYCQSATFSAGFDPLGVISSNGVSLRIDAL